MSRYRSNDPAFELLRMLWYMVVLTAEGLWGLARWVYRGGRYLWQLRGGGLIVGYLPVPWGRGLPVKVPHALRLQHMHVEGATGSGKTTLLVNLAIRDMRRGGLIVVDPKGDLARALIRHVPPERCAETVVFDPTDTAWPVGFNILENVPEQLRTRAASEVVVTFKRLFAQSWGPRLEHVLRYAVLTLLEVPGATLLHVPRLLLDEIYRDQVMPHVTNPAVREFWATEYPQIARSGGLGQVTGPVLNKIGPFLAFPEIRNIIGQPRSTIQLREIIDRGMILLAPIPQSHLGEDNSGFLGALLVSRVQLAAMSRPSGGNYRPVFLYVDEFQNFSTSAFEKVVAEARSFRLGLVAANQFREQLQRPLQLALNHNIAVRLTCLQEGPRYRLEYNRLQDLTFEPRMLAPAPPPGPGNAEQARALLAESRRRYGRPRAAVEAMIASRFSTEETISDKVDTGEVPASGPLPPDWWIDE